VITINSYFNLHLKAQSKFRESKLSGESLVGDGNEKMSSTYSSQNHLEKFDFPSTWGLLEPDYYFAFEIANRLDIPFKLLNGKVVTTSGAEGEMFGNHSFVSPNEGICPGRWIETSIGDSSENYYLNCVNIGSTYSDHLDDVSIQIQQNAGFTETERGIIWYAVQNYYPNSSIDIMLLSDSKRITQEAGITWGCPIISSHETLVVAVNQDIISFGEANEIYGIWRLKCPRACIWYKGKDGKKLKEFREIYNETFSSDKN